MNRALRIAVADSDPEMLQFYQIALPILGHTVVAATQNGSELLEQRKVAEPELVILDPDIGTLEGALPGPDHPLPVLLVSARLNAELMKRATMGYIMAYLIKPIKETDLGPAISLAWRQFEYIQELQTQVSELRQTLANREIIERAKSLLMKRLRLDEQQAFRRIQKLAMNTKKRMVDVAQTILVENEAAATAMPPA
jgi:response regulator NasT